MSPEYKIKRSLSGESPFVPVFSPEKRERLHAFLVGKGFTLSANHEPFSAGRLVLPTNLTPEAEHAIQTAVDDWVKNNS